MSYEPSSYVPVNDDESELAGKLFEKVTEMRPDLSLGDRSDLAMEMFAVVKRWAQKRGMANKRVEMEIPYPRVLRDIVTDEIDDGIN
jgi:hypothetical protein